ncbi:MAG: hypothetical protein II735_06275 [Clostridia bacterium]|nr:hypothetical protein [Clostridia bacterium]
MPVSTSPLTSFRHRCPYEQTEMFDPAVVKEDLTDLLAYEVFPYGQNTQPFESFMQETLKEQMEQSQLAENMENKAEKLQFLEGYKQITSNDDDYHHLWDGLAGVEEPRDLLYPKSDIRHNRFYKESSDSSAAPYSEIAVLREMIEKSGIYTWHEKDKHNISYGPYSFFICDTKKTGLYVIRPCCPDCRTLLPDYWFDKKTVGMIPIALVAPHAGGKTTYMTALLKNAFIELLDGIGRGNWKAYNAIQNERECVHIQKTRYENVDRLDNHQYPQKTPERYHPPVMFRMVYKDGPHSEHQGEGVIIAIYDSAGEFFERLKDDLSMTMLSYMCAIIYFMEASQMQKEDINYYFQNGDEPVLLKPDQQAEIQSDNKSNEGIPVQMLLQKTSPFAMLRTIMTKLEMLEDYGRVLQLEHIAFTIIKSDELKEIENMLPRKFRIFLDPLVLSENDDEEGNEGEEENDDKNSLSGVFEKDYRESALQNIGSFIQEYFGKGKSIRQMMGKSKKIDYSCHCVSVAPKSKDDPTRCTFEPVRMTDPLVGCLIRPFEELGWL